VRRVKRQRQVHQTAFGFHIGREAVVLHVAGAEVFFMFARELVEQVLRFFTQHVDQHVQTTAVRHAQHHFAGAAFACVADHLFEHRISASPPSSEKRFAREFRAQIALRPSAAVSSLKAFFLAVKLALPATDSIRCWIQRFSR
jgi:hypothetical protein